MSYTAAPRLSLAPVANLRSISAHFVSFTGETPNVVATWGNNANDGVFFFFFVLHCCTCLAVGYRMCDTVTLPLSSTTTSVSPIKPTCLVHCTQMPLLCYKKHVSSSPSHIWNIHYQTLIIIYASVAFSSLARVVGSRQLAAIDLPIPELGNLGQSQEHPPKKPTRKKKTSSSFMVLQNTGARSTNNHVAFRSASLDAVIRSTGASGPPVSCHLELL